MYRPPLYTLCLMPSFIKITMITITFSEFSVDGTFRIYAVSYQNFSFLFRDLITVSFPEYTEVLYLAA